MHTYIWSDWCRQPTDQHVLGTSVGVHTFRNASNVVMQKAQKRGPDR